MNAGKGAGNMHARNLNVWSSMSNGVFARQCAGIRMRMPLREAEASACGWSSMSNGVFARQNAGIRMRMPLLLMRME